MIGGFDNICFYPRKCIVKRKPNPLSETMPTYKVLSVFGILLLSTCLVFPAVVDNAFLKVQNGEIPSYSCVHSEFWVRNSTLSPRLQCGIICNTDPVCVVFDLIKTEAKRCRLLFGLPAMIPTYTTSDQSARYQKVILQLIRS